ncbi:hypothetical protein HU200_055790 [Digitaria exilis]|uniref:Uncharacterized protein n=1 Tax=Digitaria exilis TaxID=1010633 RepID=A0A835AIW1_9POAL|nr:hypothetical protein HU200_055790 [Digitaria exilis]
MGDGNTDPAAACPITNGEEKDYASWTWKQKLEDLIRSDPSRNIMPKHPYYASLYKAKLEDVFQKYISELSPKLRPVYATDSVKEFHGVCSRMLPLTGLGEFFYPEILSNMASYNALRCARAALEGGAPLCGRRADPNRRHRYGFTPLHLAAENFSVDMVKLLFRHGASANIRTNGGEVVEGLLPLHVAVENASMHKYLEDHWADGDHITNLIALLCLPEMVYSGNATTTERIGPKGSEKYVLPIVEIGAEFGEPGEDVSNLSGCQLSRKDLLLAEASKKGTKKSIRNHKLIENLGSIGWSQLESNYESRRKLCAVASLSRKVFFKRP